MHSAGRPSSTAPGDGSQDVALLCLEAASALISQQIGGVFLADVGCAIRSANTGAVFVGACIGGDHGLCAEQGAVSAMVQAELPWIDAVVAVWRDEAGVLHVIPPCGRCREFLRGMDERNLAATVVLGAKRTTTLAELLPFAGWHAEAIPG